ncbi:hypothetical protein AA11237_1926 [Acidocella aminolytica 101 = DSM 11237]|jgi:hypothetical protein|nr:hypothetical protein AA11237_1926 [Acidocella aminolytica 101 = DSM 11237]
MNFVTFILNGLNHGLGRDRRQVAIDLDNPMIEIDRDVRTWNNCVNRISHSPDAMATRHTANFEFQHRQSPSELK